MCLMDLKCKGNMSKTGRRRKGSRHSDSSSRRDSLSSLQNDGANTRPVELVRRLEDQVRREFITRQQQADLNAKLQDEYDQLRKRLAEAETYIDQLRLGASVKFDKKFVFTYEHDPLDTSARRTVSEGTHTTNRRRRLSNPSDNETSTLSSSSRLRRVGEESKLMAHLFEVRDLEEQLMALKQQLEAAAITDSDDDKLKELYSVVKGLEEHQQELSKAMAAVNTNEGPLDHKQAQDQSLVADELSRVTSELRQLQQMIAQYSSHTPDQQEASSDGRKQRSPISSETVQLTSPATTTNHMLGSEMVGDTLHSSVPEEYLIQTGTARSSQSHDLDDSKCCTSVTTTLSNLSLDNQLTQRRSVSSHDSPTPSVSTATNVDADNDATCPGGSEWSETSSPSSPLPYSDQTPLLERKAIVSPTSDENAKSQPHPPSNDHSTSNKMQQPSRIPVLAKHLRQEPLSDTAEDPIPRYQSSRKPVNFDDLTLNSAHHQQPTLSRIPVLNPSMSPPSSYYRPPSPYSTTGAARRAGVGGRYPSPHAASKFSHFVANESDTPSPGKAGRETLPRDDRDLSSSNLSDTRKRNHASTNTTGDEGMKALQDELKSLRQLLEQQQQQQKPAAFGSSSFQFPFWQPGHFPFSTPMHPGTTQGDSVHPAHEGSAPPTQKDSRAPNHQELAPSTHGGTDKQSDGESVNSSSSFSTTSSRESDHTTSAVISEPSPAKPHPLTSKVAMDTVTQQQHPVLVNSANNGSVDNKDRHKRQTSKTPSHKNSKQNKNSPSPELQQQSDQSDSSESSVSLLSSDASTLSVFDSTRLSPNQLGGFQGDTLAATETMKIPSNANLTTWVCPLCGGQSVIIDSSGTRRHRHRQPERVKTRSRSNQYNTSHQRKNRSPRSRLHPGYEKVLGSGDYDFSKPRHTSKDRSGGLQYNGDVSSNGSSSLHDDGGVLSNRSSGLHHGYIPPVRGSGLQYSSDTPGLRSSGLHYKNRSPGIRSGALHYSSDTPVVRSTGTQYNSRNRYYRRPRRNFRTFKDDSVTFAHPKATSTPLLVHSTHTHDYSSDSSHSPTIAHQPTDYIVVESVPHHRRHHVRPRVTRRHHVDRYLMTTSSDDDEPCHIASRWSRPLYYSSIPVETRTRMAQVVSLDEACRLARQLKRRSEQMYSNLSLELSAH